MTAKFDIDQCKDDRFKVGGDAQCAVRGMNEPRSDRVKLSMNLMKIYIYIYIYGPYMCYLKAIGRLVSL